MLLVIVVVVVGVPIMLCSLWLLGEIWESSRNAFKEKKRQERLSELRDALGISSDEDPLQRKHRKRLRELGYGTDVSMREIEEEDRYD